MRRSRTLATALAATLALALGIASPAGAADPGRWLLTGASSVPNNYWQGLTSDSTDSRLFFVGVTRAQDRLYVTHTARRFRHGTERVQAPTPFLDAIDPGLFERLGDQIASRPKDRQLRLL